MVIDCPLRRSTTVDMISPVARKSLILITLIAFRISRWLAGAASVNRRVAGSSPAWGTTS